MTTSESSTIFILRFLVGWNYETSLDIPKKDLLRTYDAISTARKKSHGEISKYIMIVQARDGSVYPILVLVGNLTKK